MVGIGASAGGLDALSRFFGAVQPDSGYAYIVVQHLSPDFKSVMDELLARHTTLPIRTAQRGMPVVPNTIYLNVPHADVTIDASGCLQVEPWDGEGVHYPIVGCCRPWRGTSAPTRWG